MKKRIAGDFELERRAFSEIVSESESNKAYYIDAFEKKNRVWWKALFVWYRKNFKDAPKIGLSPVNMNEIDLKSFGLPAYDVPEPQIPDLTGFFGRNSNL